MKKLSEAEIASFKSKILLFGEYSIIHDSMGLSIPYDSFQGKLSLLKDKSNPIVAQSNEDLRKFSIHLKTLQDQEPGLFNFDLDKLNADIEEGLFFESTIPQGFGVGSSGALCAAIYDKYAVDRIKRKKPTKKDLLKLKQIFSRMESFHHGTSSGLDPLICYLSLPILIKSKTNIGTVNLPDKNEAGQGAIFLLDTGSPGKTQPLVEYFLDKCKQHDFLDLCRKSFIPYNDNCIREFLKGETKSLFYNLYFLSKFLLENLSPMIPNLFRELWKQGLDTKAYYLKLCGSGGGGFILGFTEDLEKAKHYLKDHTVKVIHRF